MILMVWKRREEELDRGSKDQGMSGPRSEDLRDALAMPLWAINFPLSQFCTNILKGVNLLKDSFHTSLQYKTHQTDHN